MQARLCAFDTSLQAVQISTIHRLCRDIIKETQGATLKSNDFQSYVEGQAAFKQKKPEKAILEALVAYFQKEREVFGKVIEELAMVPSASPRDVAEKWLAPSYKGNPLDIFQSYIAYRKTQMHSNEFIRGAKLPQFSLQYAQYVLDLPASISYPLLFFEDIFRNYCQILNEWKLFDFTDQIIYAHLGLLNCSQRTLLEFRSRWDVLAVDEFQDVDAVQFEVFHLLAAGETNLNAVGDPDQAIYGFRGGDASFISGFKRWFPAAEIVQLDTNYRSHTAIIEVAYAAVGSIEQPYRAKGESVKGIDGTVGFKWTEDIDNFSGEGTVGVLAWTNKTLKSISERLLKNGVICALETRYGRRLNVSRPLYRLVYQTLQAVDMVSGEVDLDRDLFLTYAQHMRDIGTAVMKVEGATFRELRRNPKVAGFIRFLERLIKLQTSEKVRYILSDYFLKNPPPIEIREAFAQLDFSQSYDEVIEAAKIRLCTIHKAKGLEFDTVFVETSDFAKPFVQDNPDEAKRLLFVALSRAKTHLFLLGGEDQGNRITAPVVEVIRQVKDVEIERIESRRDTSTASRAFPATEPAAAPVVEVESEALPASLPALPINYRDEGLYSEDGFEWHPPVSKRLKEIKKVSAALQKEFPGDYRLENDLYSVGPTPSIIQKIRRVRKMAKFL